MRRVLRFSATVAVITIVLALLSHSANACGVCFTGEGSDTTKAVNGMILAMLAPLGLVMVGIFAVAIHLAKRSRLPLPEHEVLRRALLNDEKNSATT